MAHRYPIRVRFNELDPYDHVNHAVYLTYCESARIELLADVGWPMARLEAELGVHIVVTDFEARYRRPVGLSDDLTVVTEVVEIKRTISEWHQRIQRGDQEVFSLRLRGAIVDPGGRPRRFPDQLAVALSRYVRDG